MSERQSRVGRRAAGGAAPQKRRHAERVRGTGGGSGFDWQVGRHFSSARPLQNLREQGARLEPMACLPSRRQPRCSFVNPSGASVPLIVIITNARHL